MIRRTIAIGLAALFLLPAAAGAQVTVTRQGDENPAISVTKSIFWGGLGGLLLGGAIALVADDNQGDILKWSFVGGTFGGLALGLWHVTHRPEPAGALLETGPGGLRLALPALEYERRPDPLLCGEQVDRSVRIALFSVRRRPPG